MELEWRFLNEEVEKVYAEYVMLMLMFMAPQENSNYNLLMCLSFDLYKEQNQFLSKLNVHQSTALPFANVSFAGIVWVVISLRVQRGW